MFEICEVFCVAIAEQEIWVKEFFTPYKYYREKFLNRILFVM